jgi:AraC-like DNA-binding protein
MLSITLNRSADSVGAVAIDYIHAHLNRDLSLAALASVVILSSKRIEQEDSNATMGKISKDRPRGLIL